MLHYKRVLKVVSFLRLPGHWIALQKGHHRQRHCSCTGGSIDGLQVICRCTSARASDTRASPAATEQSRAAWGAAILSDSLFAWPRWCPPMQQHTHSALLASRCACEMSPCSSTSGVQVQEVAILSATALHISLLGFASVGAAKSLRLSSDILQGISRRLCAWLLFSASALQLKKKLVKPVVCSEFASNK